MVPIKQIKYWKDLAIKTKNFNKKLGILPIAESSSYRVVPLREFAEVPLYDFAEGDARPENFAPPARTGRTSHGRTSQGIEDNITGAENADPIQRADNTDLIQPWDEGDTWSEVAWYDLERKAVHELGRISHRSVDARSHRRFSMDPRSTVTSARFSETTPRAKVRFSRLSLNSFHSPPPSLSTPPKVSEQEHGRRQNPEWTVQRRSEPNFRPRIHPRLSASREDAAPNRRRGILQELPPPDCFRKEPARNPICNALFSDMNDSWLSPCP